MEQNYQVRRLTQKEKVLKKQCASFQYCHCIPFPIICPTITTCCVTLKLFQFLKSTVLFLSFLQLYVIFQDSFWLTLSLWKPIYPHLQLWVTCSFYVISLHPVLLSIFCNCSVTCISLPLEYELHEAEDLSFSITIHLRCLVMCQVCCWCPLNICWMSGNFQAKVAGLDDLKGSEDSPEAIKKEHGLPLDFFFWNKEKEGRKKEC